MPRIEVTSTAFEHEDMIPLEYTCDGRNISPPLEFEGVPDRARSIALICDDPDAPAGTWVHWVLFNMPGGAEGLPENASKDSAALGDARQGTNSSGTSGYIGPCPPSGTHRYFFKVYALDEELDLEAGVEKADLEKAMEGHILAEGQLMGRYSRK